MEAGAARSQSFDHLRENSIGLPQVLFQSITHMAPGAAIAFSILFSVQFAGPALPISVLLALIACILVASSIGQLAKKIPSAGGLYAYVTEALGPVPGFLVGAIFLCFEPLVAPLLFLIFAWATTDVFRSDVGWHWTGQWWVWVLVAAGTVFFLTYRDVRISTNAGVILGVFEISVFLALAIWMILSNGIPWGVFNPTNAEAGTFNGIFKGMVFSILAFIGFEAAAPLGEEAKRPRYTIPRAVIGSCLAIGIFYFIASIAWVAGTGFDKFTQDTLAQANPWRHLAEIFWGGGWVLIFLAIINSALANSNAGVNAASRVIYSMGRNGILPRAFGRTHPVHKTPHVAIIAQTVLGIGVALLMGWKWGALNAFGIISYALTSLVILVYILVSISTFVYYRRKHRVEFHTWLHGVFPIAGALLFLPPLYYQFRPLPAYPLRYGNWGAIGLLTLCLVVTAYMATQKRNVLENPDRIFTPTEVDDIDRYPPATTPV
ncbi:MAG TPA: APC family permease [Gaiellaceae bacterium]|jgi:amino acid transporter